MKKIITASFLSLAIIGSFGRPAIAAPEILAKVNGHNINKADIEQILSGMKMPEIQGKPVFDRLSPNVQKALVDKYIEKILIIDAARKAGLQNDPVVKRQLKDIEDSLIQQKYIANMVAKDISDDKVRKLYDERVKDNEGKEEIHAFHIVVKTEDEAKKIREQLVKGANFDSLARENSIEPGAKVGGGDLGYFTPEQMGPEFSAAALKLKNNEISQPVKTSLGWHIIKLADKRRLLIPSYEITKPQLQNELTAKLLATQIAKLKLGSNIKYFGELAKTEQPATAGNSITKKLDAKTGEIVTSPATAKTATGN